MTPQRRATPSDLELVVERHMRHYAPRPPRAPGPLASPEQREHYAWAVQRVHDHVAWLDWRETHPYVAAPQPKAYTADVDPRRLMEPVEPEPPRGLEPVDPRQLELIAPVQRRQEAA